MGLKSLLERFFGQMSQVTALADLESVSRLVPPSAQYVTSGPVAVLEDVAGFNHGPPGQGRQGRDLGYLGAQQHVALLLLADQRLRVVGPSGELWSCQVASITDLDAHRDAGFLVFLQDNTGLAVGTQTPVQVPPGFTFATSRRMTNALSGWDEVLAPYGVARHW